MFILNLLILNFFKITFQQSDIQKEFHRLVIIKTNPSELSLDKQNIQLVLYPSFFNRQQDDVLLVFTATFPIRTFLDIDEYFTYTFITKYFCAECVANNFVKILKGNIIKGLSNIYFSYDNLILLENIFIEIKSIDFFKEFSDSDLMKYYNYIIINNITNQNNGTMTFLRDIRENEDNYFQIVRFKFESEKNLNLTIGMHFSISDSYDSPIKSEEIYTIFDFLIGNINLYSVELNICVILKKEKDDEKECF